MDNVYHLDLNSKNIQGAKIALLPGDPFRSQIIAENISKVYGTDNEKLAWKREFCSYLAEVNGRKILITSTGIGGPSASIAIDELAQLGVHTFIRVGTTGAIQLSADGYKIKGIVANRCMNELQEPDQVDLLYLNPSYSTIVFVPLKDAKGSPSIPFERLGRAGKDHSSCHVEFRQEA